MSLLTKAIGAAKRVKHTMQDKIDSRTPVYLSPVRRIERVKTDKRICAMTFDDGPMALPPYPDNHGGKPLTLVLLEALEQYGAKGTFDVIGDTSGNYPDTAGKHGSASWGGIAYDHYPDINEDKHGGAQNCPELIRRILSGGHQITSHTYSHVLFGKKALVYGKRTHMTSLDEVVKDLERLDDLLREEYDYRPTLMRPPHYVDGIEGGFSAYDACGLMDYQYLAASFDGAGWLPLKSYEAEVEATWKPLEALLKADPDALCGQIIFQKDGYNMARRTPIADGLPKALEILDSYGYKVVTVDELMAESPFADAGQSDDIFDAASALLQRGYTVAYRDNRLRPSAPLSRGELLMMLFGRDGIQSRIDLMRGAAPFPVSDMKADHPYSGAVSTAIARDIITLKNGAMAPESAVDAMTFHDICERVYGKTVPFIEPLTHARAITALARLEG